MFVDLHKKIDVLENLVEELTSALGILVVCNETHNKEIEKIIGRPLGWDDRYLDRARTVIAEAKEYLATSVPRTKWI